MPKRIDLAGRRFGRLFVNSPAGRRGLRLCWSCTCDCGATCEKIGSDLRSGDTKSCGCLKSEVVSKEKRLRLEGRRFGRWLVVGFSEIRNGESYWLCRCDCGNKSVIYGDNLMRGLSRSCGCLSREVTSRVKKTHGHSKGRFYAIWTGIVFRCNNKSAVGFSIYGGRGIKCLWGDYEGFYRDMHEGYLKHISAYGERNTTIDRIDVNGHYSRENCRWATQQKQMNNTRVNLWLSFKGREQTLAEWVRELGLKYSTVQARLRRHGWSVERALSS